MCKLGCDLVSTESIGKAPTIELLDIPKNNGNAVNITGIKFFANKLP